MNVDAINEMYDDAIETIRKPIKKQEVAAKAKPTRPAEPVTAAQKAFRDKYVRTFYMKVPEGIVIPDATPYDYFPAFGLDPNGGICFNKPQVQENVRRMAAMNRQREIQTEEDEA